MQPESREIGKTRNFDLVRVNPAGRAAQILRNAYRPVGRFFGVLMMLAVATAAAAQTNGPALTQVVEGLFGHKAGTEKNSAALSFVQTAITATDAIASQNIVDAGKFQDGPSKLIDGVVQCMNASA